MIPTSTARIVIPSLLFVAAGGAALAFGITQVWRPPPVETRVAAAAPAILPPVSTSRDSGARDSGARDLGARDLGAKDLGAKDLGAKDSSAKDAGAKDEAIAALAPAQTEANAAAAELAVSPPSLLDKSVPVFDVARIEPTGDAVIAGSAAPGAIVELLRNGERHDQTVADQSGNFVMVPPRLPPGTYELTLRSRSPDGTLGVSKQAVAVALSEPESSTGALRSRAEAPANAPEAAADRSRQDVAVAQPEATATIPPPRGGSSSAVAEPRTATTVVSRGDSLWRISRLTYGDGTRYALVYRANRNLIRDPNRIYPGQTFILPVKGR
jgi:nucleoid-associated protein YgaU